MVEATIAHSLFDSETYMRKMDVLNRGFGGYTTEWYVLPGVVKPPRLLNLTPNRCLPVFNKIFAKKDAQAGLPPVKLITIWFGSYKVFIVTFR